MISAAYCQTMARYNAWQNRSLRACFETLEMADLRQERGAFFGSLWATGNHLLWGDQIWMSRFDGGHGPGVSADQHSNLHADLQLFLDDRLRTDARILRWADGLHEVDLAGPLRWYSGLLKQEIEKPLAICITHFFNHQTHHRGQIHAMLTAAGATPDATDLILMPEEQAWP